MGSMMDEPVVFFGSGPVAAASLRLLAETFTIEAVVTKPRPAHHRGPVPVVETAEALGLPMLTATDKQEVSDRVRQASFTSRLAVLIDFGIIVSQEVIDSFSLGIVNSHFSLLPQWRGADPITFSILSGQPTTGVSLMLLVAGMDEGPLLAVGEHEIGERTTTPELTDALILLSNALLIDTLPKYVAGSIKSASQQKVASVVGYSAEPTYSRKLIKEDSVLDWNKPALQLAREVRAYAGWPKSRCLLGSHAVIITEATASSGQGTPGELWHAGKALGVYCAQGILIINRLKPAGKAEMTAEAFLAGYGKDLV